jgi:hypothetical protein
MRNGRRGSVYVVVLGTAMIVTIIGLATLTAVRIQHRSAEGQADFAEARLYARSGIEMGLLTIRSDPTWRDHLGHGDWLVDQPIGRGTYSIAGFDTKDGDISDDVGDSLMLVGTGAVGDAVCALSVTVRNRAEPLECLGSALHSALDCYLDGTVLWSDGLVSSNVRVAAWEAVVNADVAAPVVVGWDFDGDVQPGAEPRSVPDTSVFDYYLENGTVIDFFSIPSKTIEKVVVSPASNPYGAETNAQGIYVIDCQWQELKIKDCRIVGTLVLIHPGTGSKVESEIHWAPAFDNFPALLVQNDVAFGFRFKANDLTEGHAGITLNPPGTPYQGVEDNDKDDTYPSVIEGLVYASGPVFTTDQPTFTGVVVVGDEPWLEGTVSLTYSDAFYNNPPPGFRTPLMGVDPGSWRQVVD